MRARRREPAGFSPTAVTPTAAPSPAVCCGRTYTGGRYSTWGQDEYFDFTLRVTDNDSRPRSVTESARLNDAAPGTRLGDPRRGNDRAVVAVKATGSDVSAARTEMNGSGAQALAWASGAAVAVAATTLLAVRRRRKRS